MRDQIQRVADLRWRLARLQEAKKISMTLWEKQNLDILNAISLNITILAEAEALLRASAVAEYQATGNKSPAPGVAIRMMTRLTYEPKEALKWATEHGVALKLDVPTFEKIARASPIDCVAIFEEPQATIDTDLKKVLESKREDPGIEGGEIGDRCLF